MKVLTHLEELSYFKRHPRIINRIKKLFDTSITFKETFSSEIIKFIKFFNYKLLKIYRVNNDQ